MNDARVHNIDDVAADFVTVRVGRQLFGIPVSLVHDVFVPQSITPVPLSPPEVAGVLNLRGRVVTAIDVRQCLGLASRPIGGRGMAVGIEKNNEAYGLIIDEVGEVLTLQPHAYERNPANLDPKWRRISHGVYRLDGNLMVILDVDRLLDFERHTEAA